MENEKKHSNFKEKIFYLISVILIILASNFAFMYKLFIDEYGDKIVDSYFDDSNITLNDIDLKSVKNIDIKNARNEISITDESYNIYLGYMGTTTPYSVIATTSLTFNFTTNSDVIGDYYFKYISLDSININVLFYRVNHINSDQELIGQISKGFFDIQNDVGADTNFWFNLITSYDLTINFHNVNHGESNEYSISFGFYGRDSNNNDIEYYLDDYGQFQFSTPYNIYYIYSITMTNSFYNWFDLFINSEVYDFWYNKGLEEGKEEGYREGLIDGEISSSDSKNTNNVFRYIWSTITNATNSVLNVFDFNILPGLPLYAVIAIPIIVAVLFYVLKVIKK